MNNNHVNRHQPNSHVGPVNNDTPIYMAGRDIVINNYSGQPPVPAQQYRPVKYQPPRPSIPHRLWNWIKDTTPKTRANISISIGNVYLLGVFIPSTSALESFGAVLVALAFILPGLWWYRCEKRDTARQDQYKDTIYEIEQSRALLDKDADAFILDNLVDPKPPQPVQRRWFIVITVAFCMAIAGLNVISSAADSNIPKPAPVQQQHQ